MEMFAKLDNVKSNTGKRKGRQTYGWSTDCAAFIVILAVNLLCCHYSDIGGQLTVMPL
jgi:hypothetical protein